MNLGRVRHSLRRVLAVSTALQEHLAHLAPAVPHAQAAYTHLLGAERPLHLARQLRCFSSPVASGGAQNTHEETSDNEMDDSDELPNECGLQPDEMEGREGHWERPWPGGLEDREVPLWSWQGKTDQKAVLPGSVFDCNVRRDVLHRVVRWQLAKRQQGTHKARTRREVSGGGKKPWKQKGTGRARAGTTRAPQWRGGGKAHGPVPHSHEHDLNRKVRQMGLRCALSAKASEGRLIVMESLQIPDKKTKALDAALDVVLAEAPRRSVLLMDTDKNGLDGGVSLRRASRNLPWVDVLPVAGANVYSMLQRDYLLLSRDALEGLVDRATRPIRRRRLLPGEAPQSNITAAMANLGISANADSVQQM